MKGRVCLMKGEIKVVILEKVVSNIRFREINHPHHQPPGYLIQEKAGVSFQ